jgi:hypothetical protein
MEAEYILIQSIVQRAEQQFCKHRHHEVLKCIVKCIKLYSKSRFNVEVTFREIPEQSDKM